MDGQLIARLFLVFLFSSAVRGQNITNDQNEKRLELTEIISTWDGLKQYCHSLAGKTVFCNDSDTRCTPEIADIFDTSNLPEVFTAWIDSYLVNSFTVMFIGCYEVLEAHYFMEVKETEDFEQCVLACDSRYDHIGWLQKNCYCVMDVLVTAVSTSSKILSINPCNGENRTGNGTVMNLYRRYTANGLLSDYCPLAYYLGNGYFVYGIENCNEKTSFFCNNSDIEFDKDTWSNAVETCSNMSRRLTYREELRNVLQRRDIGGFWLQGTTRVNKLMFDGYKAEQTRCTALEKDYSGQMKFIVLNCSSELPGLCINQSKVLKETFSTTVQSHTEEDLTTHDNIVKRTAIPTVDTVYLESSAESTNSFLTDFSYPLTTLMISSEQGNNNHKSEKTDAVNIGIAAGVVAVVMFATVISVGYYRRKKKQAKERINKNPKPFNNYEVSSEFIQPQTLRYLPTSVTYPSDYGVKDIKVARHKYEIGGGEPIETNATVHSEDDGENGDESTFDGEKNIVTDDLEECVVENNLHENHTYESALSISHPSNLHESSTNVSAPSASLPGNDERIITRSNVDKDNDQYISLRVPSNLENTDEDRYVSMAIDPESSIDDQVDRKSIEGQTNVTVGHAIKDQVDLSNNYSGTTTSTKINREEVGIATLRELIHDDNIDSNVHVELSSDPNRGDRIDSTVFKLFDED